MNFEALKSKKLIVGLLGAVAMIVNAALGKPLDDKTMYSLVGMLAAYIVAQGVADHGAQGAAKAAERAVAKGTDIAAAVQGVLGARNGNGHIHDDDDGPGWDDTSEEDEDDKPKELNG